MRTCPKLHSWGLIVRGFASTEQSQDAISQYKQIKKASSLITSDVIPPTFKALASTQSLKQGTSLHADVIKMGFDSSTSSSNSIISFYSKCGMMSSALRTFDGMACRDSVSWNALIHGFLSRDDYEFGLRLFMEARVSNFAPNVSSLILVVHACWRLQAACEGRNVHGYITKIGFLASSVQNSLLNMYVKFQDMDCAQKLFDGMSDRDVISWSSLISGYAQSGSPEDALRLLRSMYTEDGIKMDGLVAVSVLQACTNAEDIDRGRLVHGHLMCGGFEGDVFVGNSLVDMYSKCHDLDSALRFFNGMLSTNVVSWNSIIAGFVHNEKYFEAIALFDSMQRAGIEVDEVTVVNLLHACKRLGLASCCRCVHAVVIRRCLLNDFVLNSLLDAYSKCSLMEQALKLFDRMDRRDVISWSTMIAGFARCGKPDEAIALFQAMQLAKETPNSITALSLIEACAVSAELMSSKSAHGWAIRNHLIHDQAVGTALIDMYAKCGEPNSSKKVFDQLPAKNIFAWNTMIAALGMNGCAREALAVLRTMELRNVKPNGVTIVSVLSACSHGGLIQDGLSYFQKMLEDPSIQPSSEHYSCMVDMLGRAGDLEGALDVIKKMPKGVEAGPSAWGALLSACRSHGNLELGQHAASRVIELEPESSTGYLVSSSMFAKGGLAGNMAKMRGLMRERRLKIVSGYSLVHVEQKAHKFVVWDESHPRSEEIYPIVQYLHDCMKQASKNLILQM